MDLIVSVRVNDDLVERPCYIHMCNYERKGYVYTLCSNSR